MKRLEWILNTAAMVILAFMTVGVLISVFLRYFIGITTVWSDELITYLFIYSAFIGAAVVFRRSEDIRVEYFFERFPPHVRDIVEIIEIIVLIALQLTIIWVSLRWMLQVRGVVTDGLRIPSSLAISVIPLSAFFISIFCIERILGIIKKHSHKFAS